MLKFFVVTAAFYAASTASFATSDDQYMLSMSSVSLASNNYRDSDILLGRGTRSNKHTGNREFLEYFSYDKAIKYHGFDRSGKAEQRKRDYEIFSKRGHRFMQKYGNSWVEANEETALKKIGQRYRCVIKEIRKIECESESKDTDCDIAQDLEENEDNDEYEAPDHNTAQELEENEDNDEYEDPDHNTAQELAENEDNDEYEDSRIDLTDKIYEYTNHDILLGRGGLSNNHPGNKFYRSIFTDAKLKLYQSLTRKQKNRLTLATYHLCIKKGLRFLIKNKEGIWEEASRKKAMTKISQHYRDQIAKRFGNL